MENATGARRWIQWSLRRLSGIAGNASCFQLVGQDLTEQIAAQEALQDSERYLRQLLDSINCGVMVVDIQQRRIEDVNVAGAQLFQRNRADIIGKTCHRLVCPNEMGNCPVIDQNQTIDLSEQKLLTPDGSILPILKSVATVKRNGRSYLVESFIDISNLKQVEADLRESKERYRQFFEEDITGDFLTSADGRIIDCNPAFARMFGFERIEEILPINVVSSYVSKSHRQKLLDRLREEKRIEAVELEFVHRDRRPLHCIGNLTGHFDQDGNLIHISGYLFDDTKRVLLEKDLRQAHKMEAIGTLAGGIAHDFNNILSGILGYAEIALMKLPTGINPTEYLYQVMKAANRAKELVHQILTFSRLTESEQRPVKLEPIIEEVCNLMRASLPTTIDIDKNIQSKATIMADPVQIHQVVMNLCTNAGQAMKTKGGQLSITLTDTILTQAFADKHHAIVPGDFVCISIADTGEGIAPEIMDRIFDPFFSTKSKTEGTGLGLSVVHGIVSKLAGVIEVASSPQGTRFEVYLPIIEEFPAPVHSEVVLIPRGTESIVLIDDEDFQVDIGTQMLQSMGYAVTGFCNSTQALKYILDNPHAVDLVLTDMTMPHITGTALANQLLKAIPHLPIILCTGYSDQVTPEKALSMGIRGFVFKPVIMKDMAQKVREVLDSAQIQRP
jgi:PAS domain S-box-containing protein